MYFRDTTEIYGRIPETFIGQDRMKFVIHRNDSVGGKSYLETKIPTLHLFSLLCGRTSNKTSKLSMHLSTVICEGMLHFMNIL